MNRMGQFQLKRNPNHDKPSPVRAKELLNFLHNEFLVRHGRMVRVRDRYKLMAYPGTTLTGTVESIDWGIAQQDGSTGTDMLSTITPTFEWIRLAQRVPVRISLDPVPEHVKLRVGTTASVLVKTD